VAVVVVLIIAPLAILVISTRNKASTHTFSFPAAADAYVSAAHRSQLFGKAPSLRTAGSVARSYLRFDVRGVAGRPYRTTLRVYARSTNPLGFLVNRVEPSAWDEQTLSDRDAPPVGPVMGRSGLAEAGRWVTVDLLPPVDRNGPVTLALTAARYSSGWYASRETGATAPQLVVQTVTRRTWPSAALLPTTPADLDPRPRPPPAAVPPFGGRDSGGQALDRRRPPAATAMAMTSGRTSGDAPWNRM
jgi:hypothetical protein